MDNLAETLYRAFCNAAGLAYGSDDTPSFHNLKADARHAWQTVADKARERLVTPAAANPERPIDELLSNLVVELHALDRDGLSSNGRRLETLIGKTHALALCLTDTRWRVDAIERKLRNA